MSQHENLIDFSPPPSGTATPIRYAQSPERTNSGTSTTGSSSYNYGISSALTGLWRRFSSADSPGFDHSEPRSPRSFHLSPSLPSNNNNNNNGDGIHGAFAPSQRQRAVSPRLLPSLEPLTLTGYRPDTEPEERLLSRGIAEEIRTFLPERLKIGEEWRLVYSLYQNGSSLGTLYKLCEEYRGRRVGFVLVVRDGKDGVSLKPHPLAE